MASTESISCVPLSQAERDAISLQLEKLVAHSSFKGSRRCQALLRYTIENQLRGESCKLKERMIGIAVFGRNADYDSNSDPVVRTTATDLRKRLAQYYHEPGHENELRITLPAGSYRTEFHTPHQAGSKADSAICDVAAHIDSPVPLVRAVADRRGHHWKPYLVSACLLVALIVSMALRQPTRPPRSLNDFWSPIANSRPTLLCVGTWSVSSITSDMPPSPSATFNIRDLLPMTDAVAFSRVAAFFGGANLPFRVETARTTTLTDLTQGPVVLIGAIDNQWTMRVTDRLRFHFVQQDGKGTWRIADRKNSEREFRTGVGDVAGSTKDYAIVARLSDATSGQMSFVVAGIGAAGTTAASELVTSGDYMKYLASQVPNDFRSKNLEAVVSVQVVDSKPGAPHIDSIETW
jgi:hypothetical protein